MNAIRRLVLTVATMGGACGANLVVNGGFETGDFTGWTLSGDPSNNFVDGTLPNSGAFAANLGENPNDGSLTEILPTAPGATYTLSYWLQNEGGIPNDFSVSWNGSTIPESELVDNDPGFEYTEFGSENLLATSSSTPLVFTFEQTPAFWHLDDVSVEQMPEPDTVLLCTVSLVMLLHKRTFRLRIPESIRKRSHR